MIFVKSALQFGYTVSNLRSKQIVGQFRNKLSPLFEKPDKFYSQRVPEFSGCRWSPKQNFLAPESQNNSSSDILIGQFSFLNSKQDIGWPPDWSYNSSPKLWLYNLHYFEYLWCLDYSKSKTLVLDWIENYPLRRKQVGWEPYPTSLRLMNLCSVFFSKYRKQTEADTFFLKKLWSSIFIQTEWLAKHLERHLLGNHLFENVVALAFVGSCFSGRAAEKWLQLGKSILEREIPEQILGDGMHFERSPMYHCRITYLLAMLFNTGHQQLVDLVKKPLGKMIAALGHLTHPDSRIALLNDSAFGIYNPPSQLESYVRNLLNSNNSDLCNITKGPFALPEAGYYGFRDDEGTYIICDAARIGPDYITGHAHADMFSFEMSLKGHRVIVDSGVHDYEVSPMRRYCRSTKAHNTVEIDGQDQCEMWAAFRVARRGRPHDVKWTPSEEGFQLSAWHDGYKRLKGSPVHHREFNWNKSGKLIIKDIITASKPQNIISRLHLHPNCKIDQPKGNTARIAYLAGNIKITFSGDGELSLEDSYYCPEFGVKIANKALGFSFLGSKIETEFQIEAL
ncbi:hypothetical protein ES703_89228 [subsurface metagenome]